jgi:uncharacterized protein (TIGR02270 family)
VPARREIQWGIVDQHLDEAEFLFDCWRDMRGSMRHGLSALSQRFERRLLANVEGLVVNGPQPLERWVHPVLREDEAASSGRLAASTMAAAMAGQSLVYDRLERAALAAGEHGMDDPDLDAMVWGLCLVDGPGLERDLRARLARASGSVRGGLLEVFSGRGLDPGEALDAALRSDDPLLRRAALRAARASDRERYLPWIEQALTSDREDVRAAAIDTGTQWDSPHAATAAREWRGSPSSISTLLVFEFVARGGDGRSVAALEERLREPDAGAPAAWALGFNGRLEAIAACVGQLGGSDPRFCRLAADSIAVMLGLSRDDAAFWNRRPRSRATATSCP